MKTNSNKILVVTALAVATIFTGSYILASSKIPKVNSSQNSATAILALTDAQRRQNILDSLPSTPENGESDGDNRVISPDENGDYTVSYERSPAQIAADQMCGSNRPSNFYTPGQGLIVKCTGPSLDTSGTECECTFVDLMAQIKYLMDFMFIMALPITTIALVAAGVKLLFAQEDVGKRKQALDIMKKVIFGFIWILAAWLLVWTITSTLGRETFNLNRFLGPN